LKFAILEEDTESLSRGQGLLLLAGVSCPDIEDIDNMFL
jgi:hypothetical protein